MLCFSYYNVKSVTWFLKTLTSLLSIVVHTCNHPRTWGWGKGRRMASLKLDWATYRDTLSWKTRAVEETRWYWKSVCLAHARPWVPPPVSKKKKKILWNAPIYKIVLYCIVPLAPPILQMEKMVWSLSHDCTVTGTAVHLTPGPLAFL
jgi:hypothetical protein